MKARIYLSAVVASLSFPLAVLSNFAAVGSRPEVTQNQLNNLYVGESKSDIIKALGKPEDTPKWMNGTRSLVYEILTRQGWQRAFIDLDGSDKMIGFEVVAP